jgi:pteridine reductase
MSGINGTRPVALVTGAGRRVGRAITLELARRGCDVVVHYCTSLEEAESCATAARDLGVCAMIMRTDLGSEVEVESLAKACRGLPRLDVLIHNASRYGPSPIAAISTQATLTDYRVNALAPLILSARLADRLASSSLPGGGSIVCMTDIHAMGRPRRDHAAYAMSKAALAQMVESLARDLAPNVRVNAVAPGVVVWPEGGPDADGAMQERYLSRVPLGRAGTPIDAAGAVVWLALDATYVTGQTIRIDGGRWLA